MPIYTKFGDSGKTSLRGGAVSKNDPRVEAYGSVDELNAMLGVVVASADDSELRDTLLAIQRDLFTVGAELAATGERAKSISPARVGELETQIDALENKLPRIQHFIIPGGSKIASLLHLARTICRRAERRMVAITETEKINPNLLIYMNRLGDLLFMLAREANRKKKVDEIQWKR